jgi:hypothetical protein
MKISLQGLFGVKTILSRELLGVNLETGERKKPDLRLPVSMKRHLRRVLEAVEDELKIANPERVEFINKWKVYGEKKDEFPKFGENADFDKEYFEMFMKAEFVIPFSPFKLDLLDDSNEIIPDDVEGLMQELNDEYDRQSMKEAPPATADTDKGAETPKSDA